jgi:hypothetical protein
MNGLQYIIFMLVFLTSTQTRPRKHLRRTTRRLRLPRLPGRLRIRVRVRGRRLGVRAGGRPGRGLRPSLPIRNARIIPDISRADSGLLQPVSWYTSHHVKREDYPGYIPDGLRRPTDLTSSMANFLNKLPWRNLEYATCVEDLRLMTKAFVPKPFYDYVDTVINSVNFVVA